MPLGMREIIRHRICPDSGQMHLGDLFEPHRVMCYLYSILDLLDHTRRHVVPIAMRLLHVVYSRKRLLDDLLVAR